MSEDIVISGISGRFVESDNLDELWYNLVTNTDVITDDDRRFPKGLYEMPHRSGKLKHLEKFDARFFGYTDDHADLSDPLIRLVHEVVFETLIDSGNDPAKLNGKNIGVFVANDWVERHNILMKNEKNIKTNKLNGTYNVLLANDISYFFNFKGPSFILSSGCNAAATALNQAYINIISGQCDSAIVAGCHLCINPLTTLACHSRRVLSMDGKSKFMDVKADGYVRSEICSAVYLERAKSAKRVYSRVLATGISHDGFKEQRYAPSSEAIGNLIEDVIKKANVDKNSIRYVECHGAGTKLGDLAEVTALHNTLCADSGRSGPVWLGSVKTVVGHAETAAFMSSLAKVLLIFENSIIPANLHFDKLSPELEKFCLDSKLKHIGRNMKYEQSPYLITSLAVGASNAVTLLEPYGDNASKSSTLDYPTIIPVFSRTEEGIRKTIKKINDYSIFNRLTPDFIMLIYSIANLQNMPYRGYMILYKLNNDGTHSFRSHYSVKQCKKQLILHFGDIDYQFNESSREKLLKFKSFKELYDKSQKFYQDRNIKLESLEENARNFINNVIRVMCMIDMLLSSNVLPDQCIANSLFGQLLCAYVNRDLNDEHILQIVYQLSKFIKPGHKIDEQILVGIIETNCTEYEKLIEGEYKNQNLTNSKIENSIIINFNSKPTITRDVNDDCIRLNIFSESDFLTNVLTLLGRLYESGLDIEWNALYASSGQYPVGRGTQSVVPLLQWDHSKDYYVPKYTDFI